MNDLCALILAGGIGSRFWPKSTTSKPKQFLNLINDKTMLQLTFERINKRIDFDKIFIVVSSEHKEIVLEQIKGINEKNIIIQPAIKNTSACILMASNYINQIYKNTNLLVLPSDHLITMEDKFLENVEIANNFISNNSKGVVTIGIIPSRPETGYGYIKLSDEIDMDSIQKVENFIEKPNLEKAIEYLKLGKYLWNAGIFLFNCSYIFEMYKQYLPNTYNKIIELPSIYDESYLNKLELNYKECDNISFDYAIMEKINSTYVIPSNIGWDDIGTWSSLERYCKKDGNHNIAKGKVDFYDSNNNIVYGDKKKIVLLGIDDVFCVDADDVIIIANKNQMNRITEINNEKSV